LCASTIAMVRSASIDRYARWLLRRLCAFNGPERPCSCCADEQLFLPRFFYSLKIKKTAERRR